MLRLFGDLWLISGRGHTHPWDASAYFVAGKEPLLIDCGSPLGYPELAKGIRELGYEPRDIAKVLATHGHWDHVGGMAQLRQESDARLLVHHKDRDQIETGDPDLTAAFLYGEEFPATPVDEELDDGDVIRSNGYAFTVYHTPGHTPGSVCLLTEIEGTKLLITGDTVWGGYHTRIHSDVEAWKQSLDRILGLKFDVLTMGHWHFPIADAHQKVEKARRTFALYFDPWFKFEDE